MARQVALYSANGSETPGWLIFSDPVWRPEYGCRCTFVLDGDEWSVQLTMIPAYQQAMGEFFATLASDVGGWDGARSWASEDAEVELRVHNAGSHASVETTMRWPPEWEPRTLGAIQVDPDDLLHFAEGMVAFTAAPVGRDSRRSA